MYTSPDLNTLHLRVEPAISRALANGSGFAVLVSHLDRLKDVYEALVRAGAGLLRKVGDRWSATLQGRSAVWSLGGGEYALLIPGTNADVANRVANRLLCALERPFDIHGAAVQISGSIGAAVSAEHGKDADTLLRHADIATSEAAQSPTGYAIYVRNGDRTSPERLSLAADLRQAIEQDQLVLHYQPQVETSSGALTGVEALVRWDHPLRGLLSPDQFIPLAEQTRLIRPLSRFVLRAALKQSREWQLQGRDVPVAVNLSVHDLHDPELPDQIADLLSTYGVSPGRLCLEITESALLADPQRAREILGRLRALGVRTAIDDFGTGYSSLAYLKDLPLDELKIDCSFVKDMAREAGARAIVRAVVDLAHDFGLRAVAEGVEDPATVELLASLGCDVAQGYYFSPPLTADHLLEWTRYDLSSEPNCQREAA